MNQNIKIIMVFVMLTAKLFSQSSLKIPYGSEINVDGEISQGEWLDSERYVIDFGELGKSIVSVKHDNLHLNFLYEFEVENLTTLCFPELYIDPKFNSGTKWKDDDWWFHVSGTDCSSKGAPDIYDNCSKAHSDWIANPNFAMGNNSEPLFTFEISIPMSKIQITNKKQFGMALAGVLFWDQHDQNKEFKSLFPQKGITENPSSWGSWELLDYKKVCSKNFIKKLKSFLNKYKKEIDAHSINEFLKSENLKLDNELSEKISALGIELFQTRKGEKSISLLEAVTISFPTFWQPKNALGDIYWTIGKKHEAMKQYRNAKKLEPNNSTINNNIKFLKTEIYEEANEVDVEIQYSENQIISFTKFSGTTSIPNNPQPFAPGIVSTKGNMEFCITFTPDGKELYFTRRAAGDGNRIMVVKKTESGWTAPKVSGIANDYFNNEPHITFDGSRMYFGSLRSQDTSKSPRSFNTWYVDKTEEGWNSPKYFGPGMFVSTAKNKNLYTTDISNFAGEGVVYYKNLETSFTMPEKINAPFNEGSGSERASHPCIDWNEKFLMFDKTVESGFGGADLYLVYKKENGSWSKEINLGEEINSPGHEWGASLSRDGEILFFHKNRDIYWINSKIIYDILPQK